MEKDKKVKIVNIIIIGVVICFIIFGIYLYIKLQNKKNDVYGDEIFNYLNQDTSPDSVMYGLLSYDFESINPNLSNSVLTNIYLMQKHVLNDDGVDNIYNKIYGHNKNYVLSASNYLSSPLSNCYYYQNTLKQNINCSNICSKNSNEIMKQMNKLFGWDNIFDEDVNKFCLKNPVYSLEGSGYFVDLNGLKEEFKKITNVELVFPSEITSNKYYSSGSYISNELSGLSKYIVSIEEIKNVSKNGEEFDIEYAAKISDSNNVVGKCKIKLINNNYYIVSNSINLGNNF